MSIIVRDMDIPTGCGSCDFAGFLPDEDPYCRRLMRPIRVVSKRLDDCPFVPAADVRLVVRGKWLSTNDANKKRCSECDVIHLIAQYPHGEINFCPNCGADMRDGAP